MFRRRPHRRSRGVPMRRHLLAASAAAALAVAGLAIPAFAATSGTWTVSAPSGSGNAAVVTLTNGRLTLAGPRARTPRPAPAAIGLTADVGGLTSRPDLTSPGD